MMQPPEKRTAPGPASGGGIVAGKSNENAISKYLSAWLAAMAELVFDPRIEALARSVEPARGRLALEIVALIDALDAMKAVAVDEREGGAE